MPTLEIKVSRRYTIDVPDDMDLAAYLFALNADEVEQAGEDCGDDPEIAVLEVLP